ncbi:hypothetical protein FSP39_015575 [Pinctada imbricata]|uniref:Phospholipid-transporting ATPase n=1 Tax=Pinctada imbricata TaxID=66713 RepID=A0AA89BZH8_PINIB|nr:hypothetical protein FSP39_015575 [Pinctada imbricata]
MGNALKCCNIRNRAGPIIRRVTPNHLVDEEHPGIKPNAKNHPNRDFMSNRIRTTKYSILTFLPKNLFEQFHRFANLYFILVVALNWVPQVQAFGKEIAMIPVLFVLSVTAVKDAFEDYRRYRSDKKINHHNCRRYSGKEKRYVKTEWKDLRCGDFVHLSCDEIIPADILLLHSSDAQGICHLETSNLDGETNLKQRQIVHGLSYNNGKQPQSKFDVSKFKYVVECDLPNAEIYKFLGFIKNEEDEKISLNKSNLLLRGCTLKNTDFVEGMVLYAGHETKAMLNNRSPRYKRSKLERRINQDVIYCVVLLLLLCFVCAIAAGLFLGEYKDSTIVLFIPFESAEWYNPYFQGFVVFFTYIIIFQTVIPLPLYVSVELVKLGQIFFINSDINLYYEPADKRIECRALNITEDLGQIDYIFSDKTGTLTENQMEFKSCTVGGTNYPHTPEFEDDLSETGSRYSLANISRASSVMENLKLEPGLQREISSMCLRSLNSVNIDVQETSHSQRIQEFFLLMAICNTVVVTHHAHEDLMDDSGSILNGGAKASHHQSTDSLDKTPNPRPRESRSASLTLPETPAARKSTLSPMVFDTPPNGRKSLQNSSLPPIATTSSSEFSLAQDLRARLELTGSSIGTPSEGSIASSSFLSDGSHNSRYEAESPDELALVRAACTYGCRLMKRTVGKVKVWLPSEGEVDFEVLEILQFDSTRKRMSVIVKNPNSNEIILFTKGADSAVLSVLHKKYKDQAGHPDLKKMLQDTEAHILEYAMQGLRTLCMAKKVLDKDEYKKWRRKFKEADSAMEDREEKLIEVACDIEKDLELLGATGIEDKLQDGVPETIYKMREAGIKVWVLTGDKQETAIQVAYSSQLFSEKDEVITLNAENIACTRDLIEHHIDQIDKDLGKKKRSPFKKKSKSPVPSIEGELNAMKEYALVIDGKTLAFALTPPLNQEFLKLSEKCTSVVCCRSTPIQKGEVVKLVRDTYKKLTLAIGDGANDVSMIHTADIGVGISGQEGMQAVMASDFAICRFNFLQRLLLVHGHWSYCRLARFSAFMFYKSLVVVFSYFWYQPFSHFSGSLQFDSIFTMLLHVLFTALPPIINGILDKDLSADTLLRQPHIYKTGQQDKLYTRFTFFSALLDGLWQSSVLYFATHLAYSSEQVGIWEFGTSTMVALILVILLTGAIDTYSWIWPQWLTIVLSFVFFWLFSILINGIWFTFDHPANPYWVMQNTMVKPIHVIMVALAVTTALLPRSVHKG